MYRSRTIADAVDKVARKAAGKDWGLYAGLLAHWAEIAGSDYARLTSPVKIAFPYQPTQAQRKGGTLTVRLPPGLAMEFSFRSELVRHRVNAYLGYEAIAKIALAPNAAIAPPARPPAPPDPAALAKLRLAAATVADDGLRLTLENFGAALLAGQR